VKCVKKIFEISFNLPKPKNCLEEGGVPYVHLNGIVDDSNTKSGLPKKSEKKREKKNVFISSFMTTNNELIEKCFNLQSCMSFSFFSLYFLNSFETQLLTFKLVYFNKYN